MVDYGMEQGVDLYENAPLPVPENRIDYVFLTHAHIDPQRLPAAIVQKGLPRRHLRHRRHGGPVPHHAAGFGPHSGERRRMGKPARPSARANRPWSPSTPRRTRWAHAGCFGPAATASGWEVCPGVSIRMVDVGHLLGSASIEVTVTEGAQTRVIVFSGDIGNLHQPLLRDPQYLHAADLVVMESTYGGSFPRPRAGLSFRAVPRIAGNLRPGRQRGHPQLRGGPARRRCSTSSARSSRRAAFTGP